MFSHILLVFNEEAIGGEKAVVLSDSSLLSGRFPVNSPHVIINLLKKLRNSLPLILFNGITWASSMLLFVFYRFWNGKTISNWQATDLIGSTSKALWVLAIGGFLVGVVSELLELYLFGKLFQRLLAPITILIKSVAQFVVLIIYGFTIVFSFDYYERISYQSTAAYVWHYLDTADMLPLLVFVFGIIFFVSVFRRLYRLVGPLNFFSVMIGRYNRPREEDRIFMFLDLNSSTELAETLGNKKVSRLIQECFDDLASISLDYRAQTYQYVGDEVVLTWLCDSGYKDERCLEIYFAFQDLLRSRSKFYLSKFGIVPEFKCALHGGLVVSTQVGQLKVEIAFHGDVVNSTARMLEKCHHFSESFIISDTVYNKLAKSSNFTFKNLGTADLRGKSEQLDLFAVNPVQGFRSHPSALESAGVIF